MTAESRKIDYHRLKILVVDDEITFRELMKEVLDELNVHSLFAEDGKEGIEVFKREKPEVIFTDFLMPGMNGLKMSETIQRIDPDTPIIILTASLYDELEINTYDVNIVTIIKKPFDLHEIPDAIDKALGKTK